MLRGAFFTVLLSAVLAGGVFAQSPSAPAGNQRPGLPARDNQGPTTGTAKIRGKVVSVDTGAPLRRAQVTLAAGRLGIRRVAMTDAEGRYEFLELPEGRYNVTAAKGGYVSLQYGQRRAFEPGLAVNVTDAQDVSQIDIPLPRGSVIAGRVTDEFGDPLAGVLVQAQRYQYGPSGQRRLAYAGGTGLVQSDDRGEFRVYGLMPGDYVLSGSVRTPTFQSGGNPATGGEGFAPTFYPATTNPAEAEAVSVGIAQEVSIHLTLVPARLGRITGTVRNSDGRPVSGVNIGIRSGTNGAIFFGGGGASGADGSFTLANIPPGDHTITAMVQPGSPDTPPEYGSASVTISRDDVSNLTITTGPAAKISGVVEFSGSSPRTGTLGGLRVVAEAVDPDGPNVPFFFEDRGTVKSDGTFELRGTGKIFFRVVNLGPWMLKSVILDGEDVTDTPYDLQTGSSIEGLRVVLTDKLTDVSGSVTNVRREQLKDYVVVVQPAREMPATTLQRFLRTARPDQQGRFNLRALPPGDYIATAIEALEQGREWDPEYRPKLRDAGQRFSVQEGGSIALELSIAPGL
jgi:hypothetical protein